MRDPRQVPEQDDTAVQIAEYVCGLLKPDAHAQIHVLLSRDDQALAQALAWEEALLSLVDALPRAQPTPALRERLQRTLGIGPPPVIQPPAQLLRRPSVERPSVEPGMAPKPAAAPPRPVAAPGSPTAPAQPAARPATVQEQQVDTPSRPAGGPPNPSIQRMLEPEPGTPEAEKTGPAPAIRQADAAPQTSQDESRRQHRRLVRKLWFWRLIGVCATSAAIAGFMMPGEPPPPPVQVVKVAPTRAAILQAPGSTSTPGWTATLGPEGNLMMQPLVHTEVPTGSQALLWTRSEQIPEPRLLGRIDPNRPVQVPAAQLGALSDDQLLEITLETDADAAGSRPNGPVLFIGQMTVFGSEGAAAPAAAGTATAGASATAGPITR